MRTHAPGLTTALTTSLLLLLAACDRPEDQRTGSIGDRDVREARAALDPAVVAALDSGNLAYRERDYPRALEHFNAAVRMDGQLAAGWFGIYMAELALGNAEAAEAAMEQARIHAPGATLMHPDPDFPVPPDHPALRDTGR
jgi:tetratricopeptide (TPR) repeat protein